MSDQPHQAFCSSCGAAAYPGRFCIECGALLVGPVTRATEVQGPPSHADPATSAVQRVQAESVRESDDPGARGRGETPRPFALSTGTAVIGAVALLIAVVVVGNWLTSRLTATTSGPASASAPSVAITTTTVTPTHQCGAGFSWDEAQRACVDDGSEPLIASNFSSIEFGEEWGFIQNGAAGMLVTVESPTAATCQNDEAGCPKPVAGARFVTAVVTIRTVGNEPVVVGPEYFALRSIGGARTGPGEAGAADYQTGNKMVSNRTVLPNTTYVSTLTFEAPQGAFSIVFLDRPFGGQELVGWT